MTDPPDSRPDGAELIRVRGARVHNLKAVDVDLPRDRLVVLTGVSGSGKSSLAFDTLYAEGRRRFVESLSSYARQFLDQLERPDVDQIDGLPPTVSIDQNAGAANPRSTVGTVTEIHDYLRLLYSRAGQPHCPRCGAPIRRQTPEQMVATVLSMRTGRKVLILAPLVRGRKGAQAEAFQAVRRAGLLRARVDGTVLEIGRDDPKLERTKVHDVEAVVDRLVVREGIRPRLAESLDLALKLGEGSVIFCAETEAGWVDEPLSLHFACIDCGSSLDELEPRTFSFNSPYGACPTCDGLGVVPAFDEEFVIPDRSRSLSGGAVVTWADSKLKTPEPDWVAGFLKKRKLSRTKPLASWPLSAQQAFWQGAEGDESIPGLSADLERGYQEARGEALKTRLSEYRTESICPACDGSRLKPEARAVTVGGVTLPSLAARAVSEALAFLRSLEFPEALAPIGPPLVREVITRLTFLDKVGLGYLTLSRSADSLSGGELQRVRLARQIGSGLVGVCYVLDEPTAGLHPSDTDRLLDSLRGLRDQGNSLIVVEHDEATIRAADWLVDLGPGAGPDGGHVTALGPPSALIVTGESSTATYLRGEWSIPTAGSARLARSPGRIRIVGASARNLKRVNVEIPIGTLSCVSGVSGSGKSTLVHDVLARAARRFLDQRGPKPGAHERIEGLEAIDKLIVIDQSPIGRGPRSTPATYSGVYDEIRKIYARTREAKIRGYSASRFSFNAKGGRCEACEGQGVRRIVMNFLPDMYVTCETCHGSRFNRQTNEIRFKGASIGDALRMRVDESRAFFEAQPRIRRGLDALHEAGLGYVTLGQSATTLSGGEAQRVKLATEVMRPDTGRTLYILDEPTTGLHFADVARLLVVLNRLVESGNTAVVIEHQLDVLRSADWLVDLGPAGGAEGGNVLAAGPPDVVARSPESVTGPYLNLVL